MQKGVFPSDVGWLVLMEWWDWGLGSKDVGPASSYYGIDRTFGMFIASWRGGVEGRMYGMRTNY